MIFGEMLHFPGESCNENELALDSMWNEVCDTLIAQTDLLDITKLTLLRCQ